MTNKPIDLEAQAVALLAELKDTIHHLDPHNTLSADAHMRELDVAMLKVLVKGIARAVEREQRTMAEHDNIDVSHEQRDTLIDWLLHSEDADTKALRGTVLRYVQDLEEKVARLEAEVKWLREMNLALQAPLPPAEMVLGAAANCAEIDAAQKKPQAGGQGV